MERGENVVGVSTFLWWISWGIGVHTSAHKRASVQAKAGPQVKQAKHDARARTGTLVDSLTIDDRRCACFAV